MDEEEEEDVTAKAYASIAAQLESWTSPRVGSLTTTTAMMDNDDDDDNMDTTMDALEWMKRELEESNTTTVGLAQGQTQEQFSSPMATPPRNPKRTPLLERADTPVMSNSSSKKKKKKTSRPLEHADDADTDQVMAPLQSPAAPKSSIKMRTTSTSSRGRPPPHLSASSASSSGSTHPSYRRYHDALWTYLKARRSLSERMDLEYQDAALATSSGSSESAAPSSSSLLASKECRVELEFLRCLCTATATTTDTNTADNRNRNRADQQQQQGQQEGNVWLLVSTLRKLGLASLIWADDPTSTNQNGNVQTMYLQQLAARVESTPLELLQELKKTTSTNTMTTTGSTTGTPTPLVIQRRQLILQWMQTCFEQRVVPTTTTTTTKPIYMSSHPDAAAAPPALMREDPTQRQQQEMLQSCLEYLLAGQLEQAQSLVRARGQPWRAAIWSGGTPAGIQKVPNEATQTMDRKHVGNPHLFLWKRQLWKNGQQVQVQPPVSFLNTTATSTSTGTEAEAAMYSLLANDVETCLSNPCFRSWEHGLYVTLYSMWGRMEDEVLHWHNNNKRRRNSSNNNSSNNYLQQEQDQLLATCGLANMTQSQVIQMLQSSPFPVMRGTSPYQKCMASLLIGKGALCNFIARETSETDTDTDNDEQSHSQLTRLRFLTHLTLYLDSLSACTTPICLEGLQDCKNQVLFQYVRHLASRQELWHLLTLYASLLPEETLLEFYPFVLVQVQEEQERNNMLEQARDLFPSQGLDLRIVRQVVRLLLRSEEEDDDEEDEEDEERTDSKKMKAIAWLLQYDEHLGDALICANMLLRDFFLNEQDDKMASAMVLVQHYLPGDLLDQAGGTVPIVEDGVSTQVYTQKIQDARSEHLAFLSYLEAYRVFGDWKDVLSSKTLLGSRTSSSSSSNMDLTRLNATEADIAQQMQVREWIRQKTSNSQAVVEAADEARKTLYNVLTHPGGWLFTEEEVIADAEDATRQREISEIRARYLVLAVNLYHQVCEETASWMSTSLDDAVPAIFPNRKTALETLMGSDNTSSSSSSPLSPSYWYKHALDLAVLVANDAHGIHKAFGSLELQEFLAKLAETAVSNLMDAV
jgi:hypothetical protein